jgi:ABC-2 type transport system permease protein
MTADATLPSSLATETLLFASRRLTRWRRQPILPIQALLFPTLLLITYKLLVGKSMQRVYATDSLYGMVPVCAIAGAMFGALGIGLAIQSERNTGVLSRFWSLPVHRASALLGTLLAEAGRTVFGAVLITLVGVALGLRFAGSPLAVIPFLLVPVLIALVFAMVVISIAAKATDNVLGTWLATGSIGLVFASSGVAPVEAYPSWVRPFIEFQPMSATVETMRALAEGRPVLWPLTITLAWAFAFAAIFGPRAIRNYREAAESK